MKISFTCPKCDHREKLRVFAVGWTKLSHQCPNCNTTAVHHFKQLSSTGLLFIGTMACWGTAVLIRDAFNLSVDISLIIFLSTCFAMMFFLGGKVIDACSSWQL
jgi:hypothetical protein